MKLKATREASGKTQKQVAEECGISEVSYQRYEYDQREPGARTAIRIARALGSTVEALFGAATPDSGSTIRNQEGTKNGRNQRNSSQRQQHQRRL